ncbi:MAG TPA: hypothetical protein VH115_10690 [Solirubrobacteraceae bacterium]|nr:hypothetical protein [Solirubrobacteraceae bacterium]
MLARYTALAGAPREVIAVDGAGGCVLVVDRNRITCDDARLVAHLAADEPPENAAIAGALFAQHASEQHVRCRPVLAADFAALASREGGDVELSAPGPDGHGEIRDRLGRTYRLEAVARAASIPELRWRRHPPLHEAGASATVSVREAIGAVQAYEPIRALTRIALATRGARGDVSVAVLRLELQRLLCSPIVLNGKLRETVARLVAQQGLSLSEIAIRCGRVKRDVRGGVSGETSWLGRRLGVLPEGGRAAPTPWIHTEVLALIARRGLGVSPREVEPD